MKNLTFLIILFSVFSVNAQKNTDYHDTYTEYKYPSGIIKEKADWHNGLIIGTRQFFNEEGKLIEKHTFKEENSKKDEAGNIKNSSGIIQTFYSDESVASEIHVIQQLKESRGKKLYSLRIESDIAAKGFHKNSKHIAYKFTLEKPFFLTGGRIKFYQENNMYFYDIFLLHDDKNIIGFRTSIEYYHPSGKLRAKGDLNNGKKKGQWTFYYENDSIESTGSFLSKGLAKEYKVGVWKYYTNNGKLSKEESYLNCSPDKNLKYGDLSGVSKYYNQNGDLSYVIRSPLPKVIINRTDTIERYYENGKLKFRYIDKLKLEMNNGIPYNYSGKYEEYYENGEFKKLGFLGKKPRYNVPDQEVKFNPCIITEEKKLSLWYFFNEDGNLIKITKYNLCGEVQKEFKESDVQKENSRYKLRGKSDEFKYQVKF